MIRYTYKIDATRYNGEQITIQEFAVDLENEMEILNVINWNLEEIINQNISLLSPVGKDSLIRTHKWLAKKYPGLLLLNF